MGKVKWSIGSDEPDDLESFDVYDGDLPPRGVYKVKVKRIKLKTNKNGDDMINLLMVISESSGEKKKFNGAPIWDNKNVTDQGAPYVKQMLTALGLTWSEFVNKTVTDDEDPPNITKIGKLKMDSEPELRILVKRGTYNGEPQAQVANYLPPRDEDDDDDDTDDGEGDDSTADGDEPPF